MICSFSRRRYPSLKHGKHDRRGNDGADLAAGVGAHGVHQKIVLLIVFLTFDLDDTGRHRKRRNTCGAD